jgi:hypothetical protein
MALPHQLDPPQHPGPHSQDAPGNSACVQEQAMFDAVAAAATLLC